MNSHRAESRTAPLSGQSLRKDPTSKCHQTLTKVQQMNRCGGEVINLQTITELFEIYSDTHLPKSNPKSDIIYS
jgi:hypothetical protein